MSSGPFTEQPADIRVAAVRVQEQHLGGRRCASCPIGGGECAELARARRDLAWFQHR